LRCVLTFVPVTADPKRQAAGPFIPTLPALLSQNSSRGRIN
jgi:hypothetical protein